MCLCHPGTTCSTGGTPVAVARSTVLGYVLPHTTDLCRIVELRAVPGYSNTCCFQINLSCCFRYFYYYVVYYLYFWLKIITVLWWSFISCFTFSHQSMSRFWFFFYNINDQVVVGCHCHFSDKVHINVCIQTSTFSLNRIECHPRRSKSCARGSIVGRIVIRWKKV